MSSARSKYILAIDLGTSGPKVALISLRGEIAEVAFEENHVILLPGGGAEQDPGAWWESILRAAGRVVSSGRVAVDDIVAVSCTAQWSGTVAVDARGQPLMNAMIWMDTRGQRYVQEVTGGPVRFEGYGIGRAFRWVRLSGGIPTRSGKDSVAHILFIKNERPEIYRETHKFLEPKDYINLRLTGRCAATFDSITLHWLTDNRDIERVRYHDTLLRFAGLERRHFPDLTRAVDVVGPLLPEVADQLGLPHGIPVVGGTPDLHSAAIGSGAVRDYQGHLYVGTSSWLTCHVPFKKTDLFHNMASIPSAIPGRYFVANEQETAGACLTFLRDNILYHRDELLREAALPDVYKIFDRIAAGVPAGSDKVIFTPWLYGERTPVEDHAVRGGLHNISLQTTREHLIRAFFEGVAYNARWLLQHVEAFAGRRLDPINFIGGGATSEVWCQIFADVLDRTVQQVADPIQANVRGAGLLAAIALGHLSVDELPDVVPLGKRFTPQADHREIYDELFAVFLEIYRRNRPIYARLNRDAVRHGS